MSSDEAIARIRRDINGVRAGMTARLASLPDPNFEGAPTPRAQKAEAWRLAQAQLDDLDITRTSVETFASRIERCRTEMARSVEAAAVMKRRAASARSAAESEAWQLAADHLLGKAAVFEIPGGIVAMCSELGVDRLPTVAYCEEMLAQAEADLVPHVEKLLGAIDAWERQREIVTATMTADLPNVEVHGEATVREAAHE